MPMASIKGDSTSSAMTDSTTSVARFEKALAPCSGVSQIASAGNPFRSTIRAWIRSNANTSGTK